MTEQRWVPVVGIDEQVQVARVHVVHDVVAVGVDHLHVILHFLLQRERRMLFVGTIALAGHYPLHSSAYSGTK